MAREYDMRLDELQREVEAMREEGAHREDEMRTKLEESAREAMLFRRENIRKDDEIARLRKRYERKIGRKEIEKTLLRENEQMCDYLKSELLFLKHTVVSYERELTTAERQAREGRPPTSAENTFSFLEKMRRRLEKIGM